MAWYKTGTVAVTPGSNAVLGTGTSFIANARVGDAFRGPDGEWYEVINIASNTALSIAPDYQGLAVTAGGYSLAPMQGYVKDSADALRAATKVIASGVADMQEQVAAATEAAQSAGQSKAVASEQADIATAAAEASSDNKNAAQLAAQQSQNSAQASGAAADRAETARDSIVQSEQAAAASAAAAKDSADRAEEVTEGKAASGANSDITSLSGLTTPLSVTQGGTGSSTGTPVFSGATAAAAGAKGLVRAPLAGEQNRVLLGSGAWGDAPLMIGASATTAGSRGSVPPPATGDQNKVLSGGGVWIDPPSGGADTILYPNGGTEAAPANVSAGTRFTLTNPWGAGVKVICVAEILVGGEWGTTGWVTGSSSGYGVKADQRDNGSIIVTIGGAGTYAGSAYAGGSINVTGNGTVTSAVPCRVKVWKVK
ncbi:hypothetical protein [Pseudomonas pergaminensis]